MPTPHSPMVPHIRLNSLRTKILLSFGLLFGALMLIIVLVQSFGIPYTNVKGNYENRRVEVLTGLNKLADLKKDLLRYWLDERLADARLIAHQDSVINYLSLRRQQSRTDKAGGTSFPANATAASLMKQVGLFSEVHSWSNKVSVVDKQGIIIASNIEGTQGSNIAHSVIFIRAMASAYGISVDVAVGDGHTDLIVAQQISDDEGLLGLVIVKFHSNDFLENLLLEAPALGKTGQILFVDQDGRFLHPMNTPLQGEAEEANYQATSKAIQLAISGKEGLTVSTDYRGKEVLAAYRHIRLTPAQGWGMVVKRDAEEVFASIWKNIFSVLMIAASFLVVAAVLVVVIAHQLTRPVVKLYQTVKDVEAGNLQARAPVMTTDEVGTLAVSFNKMVERVSQWNRDLELSVEQRTQELHRANEALTDEVRERIANEERFRSTFEQAAVGIAHLSLDGHWLRVNQKLCDIIGYSHEELQGLTLRELTYSEDLDASITLREQLLAGGIPAYDLEKRYVHKDGHIVWVKLSVSLARDGEGKPKYFISVIEDIGSRKKAESEALQRNAELSSVFQALPDIYFRMSRDGTILDYRAQNTSELHLPPGQFLNRRMQDVLPEELADGFSQSLEKHIATGKIQTYEYSMFTSSGEHCYEARLSSLPGTEFVVAVVRDVTDRAQALKRLHLSATVFENTAEGVIITDAGGNIVEVNRAFSEITGYEREWAIGRNPKILNSGRHDETFFRDMWIAIEKAGQWRGEIWNRRKDGSIYPEWLNISSVRDINGKLTNFVAVFSDISSIKRSQELLDHLAHHDALTDLPNRLLLTERLRQAMKHAERNRSQLAVIFIDLDRFKNINDSLGHAAGDRVLQNIAEVLEENLRKDDTVARIGGDEFVLLLEEVHEPESVGAAVEKLMEQLSAPIKIERQEISVTASVGISMYPGDGDDVSTLLANADAAMYRAKDEGRNSYQFYTADLTSSAFERVLLENNLRQALAKEEFYLLFQPQFDMRDQRFIGAESLLRWQHPELGTVSPAKFIPIAEESGLIHAIGLWVLRTACRQGKTWFDQGIKFGHISVNVAGPQIQRGDLVKEVAEVLSETGLPPAMLELEVTEGFIMRQAESAIKQLKALRSLGVKLSIDDFGTGYSSLSYLKQLPINKLKIDQSFVRDIPSDVEDIAICKAVIGLGKAMQLTVIAEGVETQEQVDFLKESGCDEGQGYLYSRPISPQEIEERFFKS